MSAWLFKAIWVPIAVMLGVCCAGILVAVVAETGWTVPFRWLCLIGLLALIADKAVNP